MRCSTSPVGPLMVIALLCVAGAGPAFTDDLHPEAQQAAGVNDAAGGLRGSVDTSAWGFLAPQPSAIEAADLPPPAAPVAGLDGDLAEKPLSAEEFDALSQALVFDPDDRKAAARALRARKAVDTRAPGLEVSRNAGAYGSSTVVFKQPIAPPAGDWKARLGAELGMAADASTGSSPDNPLRVRRDTRGANAAFASVDVHDIATLDARVNPASENGVVATTFKRSLPIGSAVSMTLQSRTSMTETYGRGLTTSDIPMMTLPTSDGTATPRVWGQENTARFNVLSTGTSFGAGVSSSSTDTVTHNTLSAEQKLYGPVSVSTAITDVGQSWENKSVTARAKFNW